ncbi:Protein CHLOROPLAST IMPORT APPARATUS 2 [Acorus calamus]|uniref:Protein CHLOROPLAST IMPORT APPARATUS 2 n=1 Tax=Acorus calamus TaxID=4465 RepID=A0AAV9EYQ6_ACOCL|nr:Protein CHLOROPLAST IMPORT APPARATUS 2 [Acorus calamus]
MSTCISGGCGRTYKFDLDIVKPSSPSSPSTARASSQTCSSTLSESSNDSPLALSTKRARAPRKRPNQTYTEAAALLSSIYPNVFTTKDFKALCKHTKEAPFDDPPEPPLLLPLPLPALDGHGFLLDKPTVFDKPNSPIELKRPYLNTQTSFEEAVTAPTSDDEEEDYFGSILDDGVGEGIDSILGDISTDNLNWNPLGLGPFGFGRRFECGLGIRRALRRPSANVNNGFVRMLDIVTPKFETQTPLEKNGKKKKKKKAKRESEAEDPLKGVTVSADETGNSKGG